MGRAVLLAAVLMLSACLPSFTPDNAAPGLSLDADGIQPAGSALRVDFGRAQAGVIDTVTRLRGDGPDEIVTNQECGAGPVTAARWADGLTLNFLEGGFRGWVLDSDAVGVTGSALAVGQPRGVLGATAIEETTLGEEFAAGEIFGLLDEGGAEIAYLWAGVTCFFR